MKIIFAESALLRKWRPLQLAPQAKVQVPLNWKVKNYKSVKFFSNFTTSSPPIHAYSPPMENFLATVPGSLECENTHFYSGVKKVNDWNGFWQSLRGRTAIKAKYHKNQNWGDTMKQRRAITHVPKLQPGACRGGGKYGDGPGQPRHRGIQRVKLQKLESCIQILFCIVSLLTHAAWIYIFELVFRQP